MFTGISIALCTYNGSNRITSTLLSIFNQINIDSSQFELLIIDNASTDNVSEFCERIIKEENYCGNYKIINEPKSGAINARLRALAEAKFKWLLICDDDNILDKKYLSTALNILSNNKKIGALGGKGIASFEVEKPIWFNKYYSSYAVGEQNKIAGKIFTYNASLYGAGTFFNSEALIKIFDNEFNLVMIGPNQKILTRGEDTEWCYLLQLMNYEVWYEPSLSFIHHFNQERLTWNYYLKLKQGIASGTALLNSYHFFLKKRGTNSVLYSVDYWSKAAKYFMLYLKLLVANKYKKNRIEDIDLAIVIAKSKLISYTSNYSKSYKNFNNIKSKLLHK